MEIRSLEHVGFDAVFRGFERAFCDYEVCFDREEVRRMLVRRGYEPGLSFAAFAEGEIVSFTLNGVGRFGGVLTAYDTGTGTVKAFRGRGIPGEIFRHSLPLLREAGVRQYLLEVLQTNQKAINVYRKMGFAVTREFDCFRQNVGDIRYADAMGRDADIRIEAIDADAVMGAQAFCDFTPSWQNGFKSIERGRAGLACLGAFHAGRLVGCCVIDRTTGDLTLMAVDRDFRRKGVASMLLHHAAAMMATDFVKVLNVPSDDASLHSFLEGRNIPLMNRQFEMILPL